MGLRSCVAESEMAPVPAGLLKDTIAIQHDLSPRRIVTSQGGSVMPSHSAGTGQQCPVLMGRGRFRGVCLSARSRTGAGDPASDRGPGRGGGCLLDSRTHYPNQEATVTSHCARDFKDSVPMGRENEGAWLFEAQ